MDRAVVDLEANPLLSRFTSDRFVRLVFFVQGTRLLEQRLRFASVPNVTGFRLEPTNDFKVLDATNGAVLAERTLSIVKSPGQIHLLNPSTLEIAASRDVPFTQYFLLGPPGIPPGTTPP